MKTIEFNSLEDVWGIVDLLLQEVKDSEVEFDEEKSIIAQLSHFTCPNHFYTKEIRRDIERYSYCTENSVAPYPGTYGEQPYRSVSKFFKIKNAFAKKESMMYDKVKAKSKHGK